MLCCTGEAGSLGQVLYCEAALASAGASGLGCFVDGMSAATFGIQSTPFEPVYHFTVGALPQSRDLSVYTSYDYTMPLFDMPFDPEE